MLPEGEAGVVAAPPGTLRGLRAYDIEAVLLKAVTAPVVEALFRVPTANIGCMYIGLEYRI